jgi:glycosyltransferase involved in cell wall biosynthesis
MLAQKTFYNNFMLNQQMSVKMNTILFRKGGTHMRVAIFTDTYLPDVNGVSKTLARWVGYLQDQGIAVKVFAPSIPVDGEPEVQEDHVFRMFSVPFMLYSELRMGIPNPIAVNKALAEFQPTIIHSATAFNIGLYGHRYASKHNIPFVASYHTHFDQYLSHYKIDFIEKTLWKFMKWFHQDCSRIYVPSPNTIEVWGRGLDLTQFNPQVDRDAVLRARGIAPEKFVVLYVGRLAPEKNVDVFFECYKRFSKLHPGQFQFVLAGDGPLNDELRGAFPAVENPDLTFLGFVQGAALADMYAAADVFLFPSATETFGNVVLEAMGSGTPVIGAAAGGVKDNIQHEQTGLLCEAGDVAAFEASLGRLVEDVELRARLQQNGLAYVELQSWDRIFGKLLASYRQVVEESR